MLVNVDIDVREGVESILADDEIGAICELVLREEDVTRPCFMSVSVVDDDEMRDLNRTWRDQDRATDVLSLECERPDDPELGLDEPCELGDIVLAPSYIRRQAREFGTTPADECRLLLVHGILHLLGYDHLSDDEAKVMESREDELVAMLDTDGRLADVVVTRHEEVHSS